MKKLLLGIIVLFLGACKPSDPVLNIRQEIIGREFLGTYTEMRPPIINGIVVPIEYEGAKVKINRGGIRDPFYFLIMEYDGREILNTVIEITEDNKFKLTDVIYNQKKYSGIGIYEDEVISFKIISDEGASVEFEGKRK